MSKTHAIHDTNPEVTLVAGSIKGAMKDAKAGSRDLWMVPRAQIRVIDGFNVRVKNQSYKDHIRYLADSMKAEGFKAEHPLSGYVAREGADSVIYIFDGHCRLEAFDLAVKEGAELESIFVVVGSQARDVEDLTVALVGSNTGKPLESLEKASVCKRLALFGWDEEKISQRLGFTAPYVRDLLLLIGSPKEVREMVASGKVSATVAIDALTRHGDKALEKLQEALGRAQSTGKEKVTNRFMADPVVKVVKKTANDLFSVVKEVQADPSFASLSPATREKLDALLKSIQEGAAKAAQKAGEAAEQAHASTE